MRKKVNKFIGVFMKHFNMKLIFAGESVAQFKFTVLLMPNGPHKITGLPFDTEIVESDKKIEDQDIQVRTLKI